ncbi:MAG: tyrosine-type recombinase/integrase [Lawsonella sp.]
MSIHKYTLKSGTRWMVRYTHPDGTRTKKRGFTTKTAAKAWETKQASDILTGKWVDETGGRKLIGDLGDEWVARQTHLKPSSLRSLTNVWRAKVRPQWGDRTLESVKHSEVANWLANLSRRDGKPLGATTKRYAHQILNNIFKDAIRDRLIADNPVSGIPLPTKKRAPKTYLTHKQLQDFATECGDYETLILVLGYCGLRWGEAIALTTDDIDLLRRRITINKNAVWLDKKIHLGTPKTGENRTVPLIKLVADKLEKHMRDLTPGALVWTAPKGGYVPRPNAREGYWGRAIKETGIPRVTPHELRHTAASLAVQSGANVKAVQRMLGHSSAAMTLDVYADLFDEDLDALAERLNAAAVPKM